MYLIKSKSTRYAQTLNQPTQLRAIPSHIFKSCLPLESNYKFIKMACLKWKSRSDFVCSSHSKLHLFHFLLCQSPCPGTRRLPLILWGLWDSVPLYQFPLSTCPRRLLSIKIKWGETAVSSHRTCINLWVLRFLVSAPFVLEINSVLYFLWIIIVCPQVVLNKQVCIFLKVFNICCNLRSILPMFLLYFF